MACKPPSWSYANYTSTANTSTRTPLHEVSSEQCKTYIARGRQLPRQILLSFAGVANQSSLNESRIALRTSKMWLAYREVHARSREVVGASAGCQGAEVKSGGFASARRCMNRSLKCHARAACFVQDTRTRSRYAKHRNVFRIIAHCYSPEGKEKLKGNLTHVVNVRICHFTLRIHTIMARTRSSKSRPPMEY